MSTSIISCENLVKLFKLLDDVEIFALQGLDMEIERGEMVGVVGVSGSGKSTLLNIVGGLVRPTAGIITVSGEPLLKMSNLELDRYRRSKVGFVWQQGTRNLIPYLNAVENVEYPLILAGRSPRQARRRAASLLERVGLQDRMRHLPAMLSGGEQSRVAIAIALANEPELLLADEPTGELDSTTSDLIYALFKELNQELNLTTLIVSHDPGIATHVDRVIAIRDGKLAGETIRSRRKKAGKPESKAEDEDREGDVLGEEEEVFEELIVLDSAGRLQIPQEIREEVGIGRRIKIERTPDGVLIRPVEIELVDQTSGASNRPQHENPPTKKRPWYQFW
ncbi:MAG: ATP-binding cassette domain-containing protein [Chloroflexota bacterium]